MQVTLESDEIAEIVDVSIENALAPIRVENRRLLALVNDLKSIIDDQQKLTFSLSEAVGRIDIPKQKSYDSQLELVNQKISSGYVPLEDFAGLRDQALGSIDNIRNELDALKEIRAIPGAPGNDGKDGAPGADGRDGKDGVGLAGAMVDRNGELFITTSTGETKGLGTVAGRDGIDGKDGAPGLDGKDGVPGLAGKDGVPGSDGISITEGVIHHGQLMLRLSNGRMLDAGLVRGSPGEPGDPGIDGKDGASILAAEIDEGGQLILRTTDGQVLHAGTARGTPGEPGREGEPGKDGAPGRDGAPGKDVELDYVDRSIAASCAEAFGELATSVAANQSKALGQLEDGAASLIRRMDGIEARIDEHLALIPGRVDAAVKSIPRPADGHTPTMAELSELIERALQPALAARPVPKDGVGLAGMLIDRNGNLVATLSSGETRELGVVVGEDAKPVDMGEVKDLVSSTLATWPRPADGRDGLGFDDFDVLYDGERKLSFRLARGGEVKSWDFEVPVLIDRGVWRDGGVYNRGDTATYGGSLWVAQRQTTAKPGDPGVDTGWRLAVKAGRPGKDGAPGTPGAPGKTGSPGRDLTRLMPDGSKY